VFQLVAATDSDIIADNRSINNPGIVADDAIIAYDAISHCCILA
jgi:hypothetical protein